MINSKSGSGYLIDLDWSSGLGTYVLADHVFHGLPIMDIDIDDVFTPRVLCTPDSLLTAEGLLRRKFGWS